MIDRIRGKFRLKELPDYGSDMRAINEAYARLLTEVTDRIGGTLTLDRSAELNQISLLLDSQRCVALLGASGSGKSVLAAKNLAEAAKAEGPVVWFDAQTLDEPSLASIEHSLRLRHDLATIFSYITAPRALLVVDGLDRFSQDARRNA